MKQGSVGVQEVPPEGDGPLPSATPPDAAPFSHSQFLDSLQVNPSLAQCYLCKGDVRKLEMTCTVV